MSGEHNLESAQRLLAMLRTKRPYNSAGERDFVHRFLMPLGVSSDAFGNLWLAVGDAPHILWSSHTDTCHRRDGTQSVVLDNGLLRLADDEKSNCLGADCTAGVWLMTEMIVAGIPGVYLFHRGEERGGLGSRFIAETSPHRLAHCQAAIAFDRRGTTSIITHQQGARCASDAFAHSLGLALGLGHRPDPTGSFTDTANYTDLIGECSNVSVGYDHEHSRQETLDIGYLFELRDAMLRADFRRLVLERKPGDPDPDLVERWDSYRDLSSIRSRRLYQFIADYPGATAAFLEDHGITVAELEGYLEISSGS